MDDLDHMFRRLVHNIRNSFPEYLTRPFEVAELYQSIIPYRHNRRELEIETNQDYELALCQLLAGTRGYMEGEEIMQDTIKRELGSAHPNTSIYREFAATRVTLAPGALRRYEQIAVGDGSATPTPPRSAAVQSPPSPSRSSAEAAGGAPTVRASDASERTEPVRAARPTQAGVVGGSCRHCGGTLPEGRRTVFCPHCGQNLTVQRCPACATELDSSWKYCITCGRGVGQA